MSSRPTKNLYLGTEHIFTSRSNSKTITLKAKPGETLIVESSGSGISAAGSDTEVIYNDSGLFGAESSFTFDKTTDTLAVPIVVGKKSSDSLGSNELSGTPVRTLTHAVTHSETLQGISISISQTGTDKYIAAGNPVMPSSDTWGGVSLFKSIDGDAFVDYGTEVLPFLNFTSAAMGGYYSDINEDGSRLVMSDHGGNFGTATVYNNSGGVWSSGGTISSCGIVVKVSGSTLIGSDLDGRVEVRFFNGSSWVLEANPLYFGDTGPTNFYSLVDITNDGNTAYLVVNNIIKVYTRVSTTWTNVSDIDLSAESPILSIYACGTLLSVNSTNKVLLYNNFVQVHSASGSGIIGCCCNNSGYLFSATSTHISIISLVDGIYQQSVNSTYCPDIATICCNELNVVVGQPASNSGSGGVSIFEIQFYENENINNVILTLSNESNSNVKIETVNNTIERGDFLIDVNQVIVENNGTLSKPSLSFLPGDTGLWLPFESQIDLVCQSVQACSWGPGTSSTSLCAIGGNARALSNVGGTGSSLRLDSDGFFNFSSNVGRIGLELNTSATYSVGTRLPVFVQFNRHDGVPVGSIYMDTSNTINFGTSSDYRLKTNIQKINDASEKIMALRPVKFNWKDCPDTEDRGFIAHQLSDVYPSKVKGVKDGINYQQIDKSCVIPDLIAVVQELIKRIEVLESGVPKVYYV